MPACNLYDMWFRQMRKLLPNERVTRVRIAAYMIVGLYLGGSAHLSGMARRLKLSAKLNSTIDRFRRFLDNEAFDVRAWYRPTVMRLLSEAAKQGQVRLIIDGSKVSANHQLLMVALAYRKRALPVGWTWVPYPRGHSTTRVQVELLEYVHDLLPSEAQVLLVGDCEFGAVEIAQLADAWRWQYVLRKKGDTKVLVRQGRPRWCAFADLVTQRDKRVWFERAVVSLKHLYHTKLLGYWRRGEKEPWLLMTNLTQPGDTTRAYRRRMWIEEMFGDWKGHGVEIETTRLRQVARLSRLVFLVAIFYLWPVARGSQTIKAGLRHLVDRRDRRDHSVYRIGSYMLDRLMAHNSTFGLRLIPFF